MARMKLLDGVEVPFTAEEEAARNAEEAAWAANQSVRDVLTEITLLENTITERRKREAMLGNAEAIAFIQGVEDDIAIERAKL
jgi:hypothetical protein